MNARLQRLEHFTEKKSQLLQNVHYECVCAAYYWENEKQSVELQADDVEERWLHETLCLETA